MCEVFTARRVPIKRPLRIGFSSSEMALLRRASQRMRDSREDSRGIGHPAHWARLFLYCPAPRGSLKHDQKARSELGSDRFSTAVRDFCLARPKSMILTCPIKLPIFDMGLLSSHKIKLEQTTTKTTKQHVSCCCFPSTRQIVSPLARYNSIPPFQCLGFQFKYLGS